MQVPETTDDLPPIQGFERVERGSLRYESADRTVFVTVKPVDTAGGEILHCSLYTRDAPYGGNVELVTSVAVQDVSNLPEQIVEMIR